ncbi:MAG: sensor histidine kinase [Calditrichia bacterium]
MTPEDLCIFKDFEELPPETLAWLLEKGTCRNLEVGDYFFRKGDPMDDMHLIHSGLYVARFEQNGQFRELGRFKRGDITGVLPYSRAVKATAEAITLEAGKVVSINRKQFPELIREHHELTTVLVHIMTSRVREFTKDVQQNEKLMALGKLSAGLAHELNNPAAAVVRSSAELKRHLTTGPDKFKQVMLIRITPEQVDAVNDILFRRLDAGQRNDLSMMEKSSMEDEIADWLEEHGMEDGYEVAESLVDFNFTIDDLEEILRHIGAVDLPSIVTWLDNVLSTEKLVQDIDDASKRISGIVKSVKGYTHMDEAQDRRKVSLRDGISSTLTMLNHKLKTKQISVELDFEDGLPEIEGFAGELNQVWTNLIDNALDALEEKGKLLITGQKDREFVLVKFIDNGSGIPKDIQSKIFDPFFTTKAINEGTGLGLDIVHRIIRRHNGDIKVDSKPGHTEFQVCLPIEGTQ